MPRLLLALLALLAASTARAQPKETAKPPPERALAVEAAVAAVAEQPKPLVAPGGTHDAPITVRTSEAGRVDRLSTRRTFVERGRLAAVGFEGSPRDGAPGAESPAQPVFLGVSVRAGTAPR